MSEENAQVATTTAQSDFFIDSVARILSVVRDRGAFLASMRRALASPRRVFEFEAELWRDDWTRLAFAEDRGFGVFQK